MPRGRSPRRSEAAPENYRNPKSGTEKESSINQLLSSRFLSTDEHGLKETGMYYELIVIIKEGTILKKSKKIQKNLLSTLTHGINSYMIMKLVKGICRAIVSIGHNSFNCNEKGVATMKKCPHAAKAGSLFEEEYGVDPRTLTLEEIDKKIFGNEKIKASEETASLVPNRGNVFKTVNFGNIDKLLAQRLG